ncbi:hypothetical protein GCM10010174_85660 [Kutzneria viridogrisea]|uniref:DUF2029 domain-containing protein n=1 Tax=Kutzneria viridogrisea TaxID=47990 RepID=A0ABR6BSS8_9PSEU|nr:hypothetical protein [Kutzneria viridogrisea]
MAGAARNFLEHQVRPLWTRGEPGRVTPAPVLTVLYLGWLTALAFKALGAGWDVAWHFKWIRDTLAPPHDINTVGTVIGVALVLFHTYTGYGADRTSLRFMQIGLGSFLVTIPLDLVNHTVNGLDLTAWSITHVLLYCGTTVTMIGVIRGWVLHYPRGTGPSWVRPVGLGALAFFFMENLWFPNEQQEFGVLSLAAWDQGRPYAEPELLEFAASQIGHPVDRAAVEHFSLGLPEWLYPVWCLLSAALVLAVAKRFLLGRWVATLIAGAYVGYRVLVLGLMTALDFPPCVVPFWVIAVGVAVDLALLLPAVLVPVGGAMLVTAFGYAALWGQGAVAQAPPAALGSWPAVLVATALGWFAVEWAVGRHRAHPARPVPVAA